MTPPTSVASSVADRMAGVARALREIPEPAAAALRWHNMEGLPSDYPPITTESLLGDLALYAECDRPAIVLHMPQVSSTRSGVMFVEGEREDARYTAACIIEDNGGRAWWTDIPGPGQPARWIEVTD